jgi:glycosyltransferase involved in cell wall biosynthesis
MLVTLSEALRDMDCQCTVAVFDHGHSGQREVADQARRRGLPVVLVPCHGRWDVRCLRKLRGLLAELQADILHTHGYKADVYGWAAARNRRVGLLATCHNWPDPKTSMRLYAALDRLVVRGFDRVTTASEAVANILRNSGLREDRLTRIRNLVDIQRFRGAAPTLRDKTVAPGRRMVGFVGRMVPEKGGAVLLHSAQRTLLEFPDAAFVFVGDGPARADWQSLAKRLGISERVSFVGVRGDMPGVYASLDLVVLPSLVENMPMSVLEAMAAERPVVATRVGAMPDVMTHEQNGLLVAPGDVSGLAEAILRLLRDPEWATQLGRRGGARVAEYYSSKTVAEEYLELYRRVLADRDLRGAGRRALWPVHQ